jgi:hypothetical protein
LPRQPSLDQATLGKGRPGVRRATVTVVAEELQALGVIRHRHGKVEIIDRAGLERTACGCYQSAKRAIDEVYEIVGCEGWKPEARRRHFAAPFTTARPRVFARERPQRTTITREM